MVTMPIIDLLSTTQAQLGEGRRAVMANTIFGDVQSDSGPTMRMLCRCVVEMLGMEDDVFLPSEAM